MERWVGPQHDPDRYALVRRHARGGEGELWQARLLLGTVPITVAVKIGHLDTDRPVTDGPTPTPADSSPSARHRHATWRWQQQTELLRTLDHPNLVRVREVFEGPAPHVPEAPADDDDPRLYLVMNWVNGPTVIEWVETHTPEPHQIVELLTGVASALDYLHTGVDTAGIVVLHRDVKPANLIVTGTHIKLVDFGLARLLDPAGSTLTMAGTPAFLAPEAITDHEFSPASDRYAFAGTLYQLLTGARPNVFSPDKMRERITGLAVGDPDALAELLLTGMHTDPARRPDGLSSWLHDIAATLPTTAAGTHLAGPGPTAGAATQDTDPLPTVDAAQDTDRLPTVELPQQTQPVGDDQDPSTAEPTLTSRHGEEQATITGEEDTVVGPPDAPRTPAPWAPTKAAKAAKPAEAGVAKDDVSHTVVRVQGDADGTPIRPKGGGDSPVGGPDTGDGAAGQTVPMPGSIEATVERDDSDIHDPSAEPATPADRHATGGKRRGRLIASVFAAAALLVFGPTIWLLTDRTAQTSTPEMASEAADDDATPVADPEPTDHEEPQAGSESDADDRQGDASVADTAGVDEDEPASPPSAPPPFTDWTRVSATPDPEDVRLYDVAASDDTIVAVGFSSTQVAAQPVIWRSEASDDWEEIDLSVDYGGELRAVVMIGSRFVTAGAEATGGWWRPSIWSSEDGRNWDLVHRHTGQGHILALAELDSQIAAVGAVDNSAAVWLTQQDGSLQLVKIDADDRDSVGYGIAGDEQQIVVAGRADEQASVWLSEDGGENWSHRYLQDGTSSAMAVLVDGSSLLVSGWAVDRGGLLWRSENGEDWETEGVVGRYAHELLSVHQTSQGPVSVGAGLAQYGAFVFYDDAAAAWRSRTNPAMRSDIEGDDPWFVVWAITEAEDRLVLVGYQVPTWSFDYEDPVSAVIVTSP